MHPAPRNWRSRGKELHFLQENHKIGLANGKWCAKKLRDFVGSCTAPCTIVDAWVFHSLGCGNPKACQAVIGIEAATAAQSIVFCSIDVSTKCCD